MIHNLADISERVVRLFFDLLHGIKRMDVPLVMVVEFMIFLAYDGKLEANSDVEKELFTSAIDQLKERFNNYIIVYIPNFHKILFNLVPYFC